MDIPQISNFIKILQVGAELFKAKGRTDRHHEANSRFTQIFESAQELHIKHDSLEPLKFQPLFRVLTVLYYGYTVLSIKCFRCSVRH